MNRFFRITTLIVFTVVFVALMCASVSAATTTIEIGSVEAVEGDAEVKVPVYIKDNQGIISVLAKIKYDDALTLTAVENGDVISNSICSNDPVDLASNPYTVYLSDSTSLENITDNGVLVYLHFSLDANAAAGDKLAITAQEGLAYDAAVKKVALAYTAGSVTVIPSSYTVTFNNWDGSFISEVKVNKGETATAPATPERADADGLGYVFAGWDKALTNITSNITVTATYTSFVYGDVNKDGRFDANDSVVIARNLAKWQGYGDSTLDLNAADVNKDGRVDANDSVVIARNLAKWQGYLTLPYSA